MQDVLRTTMMFCSWAKHDMTQDYRNFILMIISKPFYQQNLAIQQPHARRTSQTCRNCGVPRMLQGKGTYICTYIIYIHKYILAES